MCRTSISLVLQHGGHIKMTHESAFLLIGNYDVNFWLQYKVRFLVTDDKKDLPQVGFMQVLLS